MALNFSDCQVQQNKLEKKYAKQERRIDALEEKDEDLNLEALEGKESITVKDITELMKQFQSDMMDKCLSHSDLTEIHEHIDTLEARIDANANQIKINTEVRESIVEFANLPKQIQDMSLSVTQLENGQTDASRQLDQNIKRIDNIESTLKRSQNIQNEMMAKQEVGELSF